VLRRLREDAKKDGIIAAAVAFTTLILRVLSTPVIRILRRKRVFQFAGRQYPYFCHWYNTTFDNERAVEISLALAAIKDAQGKRILEVGNVLSHYAKPAWDIIDKYEAGESVITQDIVDFRPDHPYDLIVSISTLEHVGFDEDNGDPQKIFAAMQRLRGMLAAGGYLLATVPVAYNPHMDRFLQEGKIFDEQRYIKRVSKDNRWVECTTADAFLASYDTPYMFGNALIVGTCRNNS